MDRPPKTEIQDATADTAQEVEASISKFLDTLDHTIVSPLKKRLNGQERAVALGALVSKLGHRYARASLANFEVYDPKLQRPALERLEKFGREMPEHLAAGGGLILFGPWGCGKDHILTALLKIAVVKHGFTVAWHDGQSLYADARHAISDDGEHKLLAELVRPQILAISDPQPPRGELTGYQASLIRIAIDRRYRDGKSIWITTNLDTSEDAEAVLTGPLLQRLREGAVQVRCDWPNYRDRRPVGI